MKILSDLNAEKKAELAKKKGGKDKEASEVSESVASRGNDLRSAFMRSSAILDSGGDIGVKMDNMSMFSADTLATIRQLMIHTHEFSMVLLAMLEAITKFGDEGAKIWASNSIAQFERATEETIEATKLDPLEKMFMSHQPVRTIVQSITQSWQQQQSPTIAAHDLMVDFASTVMSEKDGTPQNKTRKGEREASTSRSVRLATFGNSLAIGSRQVHVGEGTKVF
jgi:hypothetical protein